MVKRFSFLLLYCFMAFSCISKNENNAFSEDDLKLNNEDIIIVKQIDGYLLSINAKPSIKSIIIMDSGTDPNKKAVSYAYRTKKPNEYSKNEFRILAGKKISNESNFIMDSKPEPDKRFDLAFHVLIPFQVITGKDNQNILINNGSYLNIRTFPMIYSNYQNGFVDNSYIIKEENLKEKE